MADLEVGKIGKGSHRSIPTLAEAVMHHLRSALVLLRDYRCSLIRHKENSWSVIR
uniref:Si:dkey-79d12.6 n=1 Tax=Cyprinus carpio carpio TaxID=630221 RepID=A0A9J7YTF7_CYPCA